MARFGDFDQYLDNAGDPLAEGKLYFYESGTTTPKTTYSDVNNSIPNTNPVLLSAAGRQPNIFFDGVAKVILTDNDDVQLIVRDPVGETATDFGDQWVATKIYNATDVVLGSDGTYYRSLINGNQNNNPVTTTGNWTLLYSVEWNAGITYQVGAVVTYDGEQYQSLQGSNLNQNPSTQTAYWVLLSFAWLATATYSEDQNAVGTDGILYTSLQNSNTGNDPATSPAYWVGTSAAAAASAVAAAASAAAALVSENAAAADAIATAADVVQTGLDAAATAADAIATAADRVQTGLDAAATAADVILTNADAVATAADRVQTGLDAAATSADAIATAADRVQTGLDVIATNADASSTAADAIATAADVVQTGLDVVATSADVVQTGLDVTAAATSASNAASSATASANSATASANSAAAAATSYDNFDDRYLGQKGTNPALDNDGDALLTGALYFNTSSNTMKVYTGSNWQDTAAIVTDITQGSLTKTFTAGESSTIALNQTVLAPVVSVTKEIPQTGVTNNSWDVNSTTENYTRLDSAYATTLDFNRYDVSSASYTQSFSVAGQETTPRGLVFNTDGTKMFVVGSDGDDVNEYDLSTAFDVSTAVYSQNFSVSAQAADPQGIAFNVNGTKMFVVSFTVDSVSEYNLSTGFDVSTASYSQSFSVAAQETTPTDVSFNANGTKMFILGSTGDAVYEYDLTTGFDLSTSSYSQNFSVSAQDTSPTGLTFSVDGTKMIISGNTGDDVNEYTLSTGFDVSTASYVQRFSVAAQDLNPSGLTFNNDGTKMFVIGRDNDSVYEYYLTPSLELGTGSFASSDIGKTVEANSGKFVLTNTDGRCAETTQPTSYAQVASGDWEMYGVIYNPVDGDLELSGVADPNLYFDTSTAIYEQSFSVADQETEPQGVAFNNDGTKMYIVGSIGDDVNEYSLSIAFDISTAFFVDSFSVAAQETAPTGMAFNNDGTKMFIIGYTGDDVNEYNLSSGFDISTAVYSQNFSVSAQDATPTGITFNTDGTKMFVTGYSGQDVSEYDLSTGFDLSTAVYSQNFSVASQETEPQGVAFNSDGTRMFIVGSDGANVSQYTLETGFDVSTAYFVDSFSIASQDTYPTDIAFNNDGSKMYIVGATGDDINQYAIGQAYPTGYQSVHTTASIDSTYWTDINSMTADQNAGTGNVYYAISTDDRTTWTVIDNTGERDIVRNNAGTWQYNSNSAYASETWVNGSTNNELATLSQSMEGASRDATYDISLATFEKQFSVANQDNFPNGIAFNPDGSKMFLVGDSGNDVNEYDLSISFDVATAVYSQNFSVSAQDANPSGLAFNPDGTKMFVVGVAGDDVNEYDLSVGFDVSTSVYSQNFSVAAQDANPRGLAFNTDGTKMFVVGDDGNDINEYTLSTGFDVSSAVYSQNFSVGAQDTAPHGLAFNANGTKMFVVGGQGDDVNEYSLSTGFDVSSASYYQNFSIASQETQPTGIAFNNDGTKMYITGNFGDAVYQYDIPENYYANQMDKTQLDAVTDPNHIALSNDLDLAIVFNMTNGTTVPSSNGIAIDYDANVLNKGAILGTDYDFDAPAQDEVRITSLINANLKVRVV
jgi:DNA-binding beta-propeller fold protein YncE